MKNDFQQQTARLFLTRRARPISYFENGWSVDGTQLSSYSFDAVTSWYKMKLSQLPLPERKAVSTILTMNITKPVTTAFSTEDFAHNNRMDEDDATQLLTQMTKLNILRLDTPGLYVFLDSHAEKWHRHQVTKTATFSPIAP